MNVPEILGFVVGALSAYWGAHTAVKVEIARLEEKYAALKEKVDSDHARLNEIHSDFSRAESRK